MAEPTEFPEANTRWSGQGDTGDLPAYRDAGTGVNISCWVLSADEIVEVRKTGRVWLHVWGQHPPVYVSGESPFPLLVRDHWLDRVPESCIRPGVHEAGGCNCWEPSAGE